MVAETKKETEVSNGTGQPQPGETIAPGGKSKLATELPTATPTVSTDKLMASPPTNATEPKPNPDAKIDIGEDPNRSRAVSGTDDISWTASEFVAHEKSAGWYAMLAVAAVLVAGIIYLLTKDAITTGVVLIGALFLGIYAGRKPRQLQYRLSSSGISIGNKQYSYEAFRSFSVVEEGAFSSIVLMPLKRFAPTAIIYCAPEDEDKIIDLLAERLPFEEHHNDVVDQLMRRIRF